MANSSLLFDRILDTKGFHGYNIKFSPYDSNILAISTGENFGIQGSGSLLVFNFSLKFPLIRQFVYNDVLLDLCWHKSNHDLIFTGSGDGYIQLWSTKTQVPITNKKLHSKEVSSIDCCHFNLDYAATSSWDSSVTLCEVNTLSPTCILRGHNGIVYETTWSRLDERILASVAEDGAALIWSPFISDKPTLALPPLGVEVLSCDWSFSDRNLLVTAATNAVIYGWDLRAPRSPLFRLLGHDNAVRRVRFSPFIATELVSVSYDFTTRLWDTLTSECYTAIGHTEFVYGVDYSLLNPGLVADCSWDRKVQMYKIGPRSAVFAKEGNLRSSSTKEGCEFPLPHKKSRPLPPLPAEFSLGPHIASKLLPS